MKFICQTQTCAIAISKAAFPASMACPVCSKALVELIDSNELSEEDENLIASLPYVIAYPLKRTLLEKHPWTKINLFKDTFLNYLKYLGLLSASEFFNSPLKNKRMVALFQQSIAEPSFGTWNLFVRETLKYLNENKHPFFCPELNSYYETVETGKKRKLYHGEIEFIDANGDIQLKKQEATAIGMLINFRNRYLGHGLTLDEKSCLKLWEEYFPIFRHLLEQMNFASKYAMSKHEHSETYLLHSSEIKIYESKHQESGSVWLTNPHGETLDVLPFFVVPGEVSLAKEDKEQILAYESYTGKTIKFFSPEGTEKQSSGKILEKLNLLLRNKQKEVPYSPETFTKEVFITRIAEENKLLNDTLVAEKKVIPGIYVHREEIEIKLREWIGARASILFISAEAGSGKTNLLVEIQKQYNERNLPSLLIRAGRMEKPTIKEQIAYLLNIDLASDLSAYRNIAGTQNEPSFILIDGLNEAHNAEEIWNDIIEIAKLFEAGSLKFVVSSRANSKADLNRYALSEEYLQIIYGENSENKEGLNAYVNWLTPLNMKELNAAWDNYTSKDKARFKPQFKFDDIASFDRGLYNQISNPLVLRIFLEIYNGKSLSKKGILHLNIWKDWLKTFSADEQVFFNLLANEIWEKGENELFLDDLLKNDTLKTYLVSDNINSPYPRLKNLGWISRYTKDLNACIGFTVEGSLLYVLGQRLQNAEDQVDLAFIDANLKYKNKLHKGGIESYLSERALMEDISLITELIDSGTEGIDLCITPLLLYLKSYGSKKLIEQILETPTENDWKALLKLDGLLEELQLHVIRKEFLSEVMPLNYLISKEAFYIGLKTILILDKENALNHLAKLNSSKFVKHFNIDILIQICKIEETFGNFDNAIETLQKCISNNLNLAGEMHYSNAELNHIMGRLWKQKGNYEKALEFTNKALTIRINSLGYSHLDLAKSYNNIGVIYKDMGDLDKSLEYQNKTLEIRQKTQGNEHPDLANSLNNIGFLFILKGEYEKAMNFLNKSLTIKLRTLGGDHISVSNTLDSLGELWYYKGDYEKALHFHKNCIEIRLKNLGNRHPLIAETFYNMAKLHDMDGNIEKAITNFKEAYSIDKKYIYALKLAACYEKYDYKINSLEIFIQAAEIQKDEIEAGAENEDTKSSMENTLRLAKELNKMDEVPDWIRKFENQNN